MLNLYFFCERPQATNFTKCLSSFSLSAIFPLHFSSRSPTKRYKLEPMFSAIDLSSRSQLQQRIVIEDYRPKALAAGLVSIRRVGAHNQSLHPIYSSVDYRSCCRSRSRNRLDALAAKRCSSLSRRPSTALPSSRERCRGHLGLALPALLRPPMHPRSTADQAVSFFPTSDRK